MAAIEETGNGNEKKCSNVRSRRISTRVDMTPMVDLGFLLITFFMLATTMSKPTAMSVFFPAKDSDNVLTIFLGANDDIYYLDGIAADDENAKASLKTTRPGFDLRNVIFDARKRVRAFRGNMGNQDDPMTIVIKPTDVSSYKNMVDAMDEMAITKSKRYALVDELTADERKVLGDRILAKK
jgi:biopolymer transport protein ExbD